MSKYIVRKMQEVSPIEMTVRYGVFDSQPSETGVHCESLDDNLLIWTHSELIAEKIAELLTIDDFCQDEP